MRSFDSTIYDEDLDEDVSVTVEITSVSPGCRATYWEPGEDPEIEIAVYTEDSDKDIFDTLGPYTQERLVDEAWEHVKGQRDDY